MPQLYNPPEDAPTAVFSPLANKAVAAKPRLADTLNAPRSHWLRTEKHSSEAISEEMGFLNSINEEKMVEGEGSSISCAMKQENAAGLGVSRLVGENSDP